MMRDERAWRGRPVSRRWTAVVAAATLVVAAACGGDSSTGPGNGGGNGGVGLDLAVGESRVVTGSDQGLSFSLPAPGDGGAEYRLAVQSAVESGDAGAAAMRLAISADGASSSVSAAGGASPRRAGGGWELRDAGGDPLGYRHRTRLQRESLEMLQRRGIRPSDGIRGVRAQSMLPSGQTPQEGDELQFWFPVEDDGGPECDTDSAETVTATVQAVGQRVAMVEGNNVDDGLSTGMDYQALADEFDDTVFGTDVAYFGEPSDIDGNGRVLVLFTNKVNEFSAQRTGGDGGGLVSGFFIPADLADSGDPNKDGSSAAGTCAAGNEAEIMWLMAPDPDASTGEGASVAEATRSARSTASHEFQHLLNLGNRLFDAAGTFDDAEEAWLNEGLSHIAEEIVGLAQTGAALRDNLVFSDVTGSAPQDSIFNTFLINDFANLARHLQAPPSTQAIALDDPSPTSASLRMRGFAWMFLRWLSDREHGGQTAAVPGAGDPEEAFFRQLAKADGGDLSAGVANIESATGREWPALLADFGLAMAVDDDAPRAEDRQQVLTWNLRDMYRELEQNIGSFPFDRVYPLATTENAFTSATHDFETQAGTGRYFTLNSSGSASGVTLEVTDQTGSPLTSGSPQVTIIRTR